MQFQSQTERRSRHLLSVLTFGASLLGGRIGLLLGRQADLLFNIDAGIVGLVVGAVVGSLLPLTRSVHPLIRLLAAGVGVALPALVMVGSTRVAPEVLWGMIGLAMVCSAIITTLIRLIPGAGRARLSRRWRRRNLDLFARGESAPWLKHSVSWTIKVPRWSSWSTTAWIGGV